MWRLFRAYYADVCREDFERDLAEKAHVIVLRDVGDRSLCGFSTLKVYDQEVGGRRFRAVFSGDTIVDAAYWGQSALHWTFLRFLVRQKLGALGTPLYWFLISKGYKTYLLLARNFPEHWPRHDRPTPPHAQAILDALSTARYGDAYDPTRGVLSFPEPHGRLRAYVAPLTEDELAHPTSRSSTRGTRATSTATSSAASVRSTSRSSSGARAGCCSVPSSAGDAPRPRAPRATRWCRR